MEKSETREPELALPAGTHVVMRRPVASDGLQHPAGLVGVVVELPAGPDGRYRIRLAGGEEILAHREELGIRKQRQRDDLAELMGSEEELSAFIIYRCVVGSRAYGLEGEKSDTDRRGIYLPPADRQWSLSGVPEQLENAETQECYWELRKFLILALKANPNILECLYTPLVEMAAPLVEELRANRGRFLSRFVYETYNGYVLSQFKKLEGDLRNKGEIKWKHAMHLVRLLLAGVAILREGEVPVHVGAYRERLLAVRRGEVAWAEVNAWRLALHAEFEQALAATRLPQRPDYEWANAFLVRARRSMVRT